MIFRVDFVDSEHFRNRSYTVKAESRSEASKIADKIVAVKNPHLRFCKKLITETQVWTEEYFHNVEGMDDFYRAVVLWKNGGKSVFESNDDAIEFFRRNKIHFHFEHCQLLKDNSLVGYVFGEGVRVDSNIVKF